MKTRYINEPKKPPVVEFKDLKVGDVFKTAQNEVNIKIVDSLKNNTFHQYEDGRYSGMWFWGIYSCDPITQVEKLDAELVINKEVKSEQ